MKRNIGVKASILAAIAGIIPSFGMHKSLGTERGSIVPGRINAPTVPWHTAGTAGSYGAAIIGTKKYRSWKRKNARRYRNANGGRV